MLNIFEFPWSALGVFARGRLAQSTTLIPVLGYAIILSDYFKYALNNTSTAGSIFGADVKLFLIYYGLMLIACCVVVFNSKCPSQIKWSSSSEEYAKAKMLQSTIDEIAASQRLLAVVINNLLVKIPNNALLKSDSNSATLGEMTIHCESIGTILDMLKNKLSENNATDNFRQAFLVEHSSDIFRLFVMEYIAIDRLRPTARRFALMVAVAGFACLLLPSADTFFLIVKKTLRLV